QYAGGLKDHPDGRQEIPHVPTAPWLVGIDSAGHAEYSGNMHRVKREVEPDDEKREVQPTQRLAVHLSRHLGKPIIKGAEKREQDAAHDDVVEMGHHKVGVSKLPVEGRRTQHDTSQTGDEELEKKTNTE